MQGVMFKTFKHFSEYIFKYTGRYTRLIRLYQKVIILIRLYQKVIQQSLY